MYMRLALVSLAGVIAAYGITFSYGWILGAVASAVFLHILYSATPREGAWYGLAYGVGLIGTTLLWLFASIPMTSSGIESPIISALLVTALWALTTSILALATSCFGYLTAREQPGVIILAALWVTSEILRSLLYAIITWAPENVFGIHWTFGYSGYLFASTPFVLSLAPLGGVYALSTLYILLAYLLAQPKTRMYALLCIVILALAPALPRSDSTETLRITAVTTHNPTFLSTTTDRLRERATDLYAYLRRSLTPTDILVLPEDTRFTTTLPKDILRLIPASVIVESSRYGDTPAQARVTTFSRATETTTPHYAKMLLTPAGEYMPWWLHALLPHVGFRDAIDRFDTYKTYTHGHALYATPLNDNVRAGATMCSEIYSPIIQARMAQQSQLLINLASHASLHGSSWLYTQIQAISRVRAAENDRFLVQAVNANNSFIVDNYGVIVAQTDADTPYALLTYDAALRDTVTPFSRAPYAVPILSLILILGYYAKRRLW